MWNVKGKIIEGHKVASGQADDERFPEGTLKLQWPLFKDLGLELDEYYRGTINVSIAPFCLKPNRPAYTFRQVKWHPDTAPEDFSFFDCRLRVAGTWHTGLIYYPHPETKPEHHQEPTTIEILMPEIRGVTYDMPVRVESESTQSTLVCP
jgi:hypothetical protein